MYRDDVLLLFDSTRTFIKASELLRGAGFSIRVISVPEAIRRTCGASIGLTWKQYNAVSLLLDKARLDFQAFDGTTHNPLEKETEI